MRKTAIMVLFLLLCPVRAVLCQQSQGEWEPFKDVKDQKRQELARQPLTNESIIGLVKIGFSDETIISMIQHEAGKYCLRVDDVTALKKAGVSEGVIAAMSSKMAIGPTPAPVAPAPVAPPGVTELKREPGQGAKEKDQPVQPLTNDSIVKLVKAGLGEDTIISIVNTQPGQYSLGADDIAALKKAGVSERVITAMLRRWATHQAGPSPPSATPGPSAGLVGAENPPKLAPIEEAPTFSWPDYKGPPAVSDSNTNWKPQFDDAAYHACLARSALIKAMTPEQKAAFKEEEPCPFSQENDRAYHACLEEYGHDIGGITVERICAQNASDPNYVRSSHKPLEPMTIKKVRKVYVKVGWGSSGQIRRMLGKDLAREGISKDCLEIVDNPSDADAVLVETVRKADDESGITTCSSGEGGAECVGGGIRTTTSCGYFGCSSITSPIYDHILELHDAKVDTCFSGWSPGCISKRIGDWEYNKGNISNFSPSHHRFFTNELADAVGCGTGIEWWK